MLSSSFISYLVENLDLNLFFKVDHDSTDLARRLLYHIRAGTFKHVEKYWHFATSECP